MKKFKEFLKDKKETEKLFILDKTKTLQYNKYIKLRRKMIELIKAYLKKKEQKREEEIQDIMNDWGNL